GSAGGAGGAGRYSAAFSPMRRPGENAVFPTAATAVYRSSTEVGAGNRLDWVHPRTLFEPSTKNSGGTWILDGATGERLSSRTLDQRSCRHPRRAGAQVFPCRAAGASPQ